MSRCSTDGCRGLSPASAIRWAIAEDAHRIDVEFDEVAGYPRHVSIDLSAEIADDEVAYIVESITER